MSEGTEIKIRGKKFNVSIDGLTPLEISALAKKIDDDMLKVETERDVVDSYKQIIMVALEYAAQIYMKDKNFKILKEADSGRIEALIKRMEKNLQDETLF